MAASNTLRAQADSTYWYVNGLPDYWYYQIDMFAFRGINGADYVGYLDTNVVQMKSYHPDRRDQAVEIHFKPTATPQERMQEIMNIYNSGQLETIYPIVNRNPLQLSIASEWYLIDDLILVLFENPNVDSLDVVAFMDRYGLSLHHAPPSTLPDSVRYTYVFKLPNLDKIDLIGQIRVIYENENGFVREAGPNFVNYSRKSHDNGTPLYTSDPPAVPTTITNIDCSNLNDPISPNAAAPQHYKSWHLDNQGFTTSIVQGLPVTALTDADADICECWNMGYTGENINMAIMGDGFFISTHPDMTGATIINALDCQTGNCYTYNHTVIPTPAPYTQGLVQLAGTVVSQPNNSTGTAGIAPKTAVLALMTSDYQGNSSTAAVVAALQKMRDDWNIDVGVTNIVSVINDFFVYQEVVNVTTYGRENPYNIPGTPTYSMAFIASPGNEFVGGAGGGYYNPPTTTNRYPAAYEEVISVIGTTATDKKKEFGDNWGYEAVNYGSQYTLAAPTAYVHANNLYNLPPSPGGSPSYGTNPHNHTQDIAPAVVGGIVAMMLEKNKYLTATQIKNALIAGADEVGGYNYISGVSEELANGRVSCEQAMSQIMVTSLTPPTALAFSAYLENETLHLKLPESLIGKSCTVQCSDMAGRVIASYEVMGQSPLVLPFQFPIAAGVYHLNVISTTTPVQPTKILIYE